MISLEKKARARLLKEAAENPLLLYGKPIKLVISEKYLGFHLGESVSDSITITINKRIGVAIKSIYDARAIVEDCRANSLGGLQVIFDIWEQSICPMLYYGCELWSPMPPKALKSLKNLLT